MDEPRVVEADNAGLFALSGTRSFILGRRTVVVVDPGPADPDHLQRLAEEVGQAREGTVLLTHRHPDHAAGAPPFSAQSGFPIRAAGPDGDLQDGMRLETDAGRVQVVATPGHSRDHLCFYLEEAEILLAGDLVLGTGTTTWVGEYPGCVGDYLSSLDRVQALRPRKILPAHGPPLLDPDEALNRFRAHRLARIQGVRQALENLSPQVDPGSSEGIHELVDRVYGDALPAALREGAGWSVRAILEYLDVTPFPAQGAPTEAGGMLAD